MKQIDIYPVDMGYGRPRAQRGRPMLADGELGKTILDRVAHVSAPFNTKIDQREGRGIIRVD